MNIIGKPRYSIGQLVLVLVTNVAKIYIMKVEIKGKFIMTRL